VTSFFVGEKGTGKGKAMNSHRVHKLQNDVALIGLCVFVFTVLCCKEIVPLKEWNDSESNTEPYDTGSDGTEPYDTGSDGTEPYDTGSDGTEPGGTDTHRDSDTGLPTDCKGRADFTLCYVKTNPDRSYDICIKGTCQSPGCGTVDCNTPGPHFKLADTNQRRCYNDTGGEMAPCPASGAAFYGQDAQYGWDAVAQNTADKRFTVESPLLYNQPVVKDNVTGLKWQGCSRGLKGPACTEADAVQATSDWATALSYCDTLSWGGYTTGWRLPDRYELDSIVDAGRLNPAIDKDKFPNTLSDNWFWSSSCYADSLSSAWIVHFYSGYVDSSGQFNSYYARCVRSGP
jgi:hypothetical protein